LLASHNLEVCFSVPVQWDRFDSMTA